MFDICTNVHFDSYICLVAIADILFLGDLTKPAITIAGIDRFGILFAVRRCIVATKFC